jgi:hypothetical protein
MTTRADFYVGRGKEAEWIGSIAWDGYPGGISLTSPHSNFPQGKHLFDATNEREFRERVSQFFENRDDVTLPDLGWPWPWDDSQTTDFAYAFDEGKVWASCFGTEWFLPTPDGEMPEKPGTKAAIFPNMKHRKNVTLGKRSGVIGIGG